MNITSIHLKAALLTYFRFGKQYVASDEVGTMEGNADIMVDTGKLLIEVETKISRSDLFQGEKRKASKHELFKALTPEKVNGKAIPNHFYIAVPTELLPDAEEWVLANNRKYGILECRTDLLLKPKLTRQDWKSAVRIIRKPCMLHDILITEVGRELIGKRLSSYMTDRYQTRVFELNKNNGEKI